VPRNIIGFVPLGFAACGFFSFGGTKHRAILLTILLGATTSLGIEVLQAFIPYRESGLTDVITNTLGTAVGALSFGWERVGNIFRRPRMDSRA
jgi:VanZ family protein